MPEELNIKNTSPKTPSFSERHHGNLGLMLGALILLVVIILGGLYLWGQSLSKNDPAFQERVIPNNEPETPRAIVDTQILETLSPSDDLGAIEADLNSTNLDSIDADMTTIDAELNTVIPE